MIVSLPKETIDEIFAENGPKEGMVKLFRLVIKDWDKLESVGHFPQVHRNTALYIMEQIQRSYYLHVERDDYNFNEVRDVQMMWMNQGFGCIMGGIKEWEVFVNTDKLVYKKDKFTYVGLAYFKDRHSLYSYYEKQGYDVASTNELLYEETVYIGKPKNIRDEDLMIDGEGRYFMKNNFKS